MSIEFKAALLGLTAALALLAVTFGLSPFLRPATAATSKEHSTTFISVAASGTSGVGRVPPELSPLGPRISAFGLATPARSSDLGLRISDFAVEGAATRGHSLFDHNCAHCHGDDARGDEGPSLYDLKKSDARITKIIREGIKGEMPRFGAKFNDADIQALIAYLRTLKS